jgi:hypothetical protein
LLQVHEGQCRKVGDVHVGWIRGIRSVRQDPRDPFS